MSDGLLGRREAIVTFLAFALVYFFSALLRAVTATLAPVLSAEFDLTARHLGLLAGGYFLGFSLMQLPLGNWLDRHGPKRVILGFLGIAVLGCLAFGMASGFHSLLASRILCGVGVCAGLMAPMTGFRRWLTPTAQLRANSWMLMTGSLGMLASTLPVQWLVPQFGWRVIFVVLAGLIGMSMLLLHWIVPAWRTEREPASAAAPAADDAESQRYASIWRNAYFRKMTAVGFFNYGGMIAIQTLWAGPWMVKVAAYTPLQAATGLFWINLSMLCTFWTWGWITPWLSRHGLAADRLMARGLPASLLVLAACILLGPDAGWPAWALFCVTSSVVSLSQPSVGLAFAPAVAGRALSAYNLVIFLGVFVVQWGIGLAIDALRSLGLDDRGAFTGAMALFLVCCVASYLHFLLTPADNRTAKAAVA